MTLSSYFEMGGYAAYVWPAYGLAAAIMLGLWAVTARSLHAREAELKTLQQLSPGRRGRAGATAQTPNSEG